MVGPGNEAGKSAGVQPQPLRTFARAGWKNRKGRLRIFQSVEQGLELARQTVEGHGSGATEARTSPSTPS